MALAMFNGSFIQHTEDDILPERRGKRRLSEVFAEKRGNRDV
jgi:hypothetical protein